MKKLKRRSLLRLGALSGLASGLSATAGTSSAVAEGFSVKNYVRLGRTEMKVADVALGANVAIVVMRGL